MVHSFIMTLFGYYIPAFIGSSQHFSCYLRSKGQGVKCDNLKSAKDILEFVQFCGLIVGRGIFQPALLDCFSAF